MRTAVLAAVHRIPEFILSAIVLVLFGISPLHAGEVSVDDVKARMTGLYILEEWHKDGEVLRPPQAQGRFILLNGVIMTILDNKMQPSSRATTVLVGKYELTSEKFSYGYDDVSIFTEEADSTKVSHKPLWEGMRGFIPSIEGDRLRLRQENGMRELLFTSEGLDYSENGKLLRKWRRTTNN